MHTSGLLVPTETPNFFFVLRKSTPHKGHSNNEMLTTRRRANKPLLGTRVCAPWKDGFFYSGIIEAVKSKPAGEHTYTILFDDGYIAEVDEEEIVGPGFASSSEVQLIKGQLVYISLRGREVCATVLKNEAEFGEILVSPKHEHNSIVAVKASDVHLTKGQKYSRELGVGEKVSESILCPVPCKIRAHSNNRYVYGSFRVSSVCKYYILAEFRVFARVRIVCS